MHVANWHISDHSLLREHRPDAHDQIAAGARRRRQRPEQRYGAALVGRAVRGVWWAQPRFCLRRNPADVEVMRLSAGAHGADPKINTGVNITPLMAAAGIAWASNQDRASEARCWKRSSCWWKKWHLDVNFVADTGETAMHAAAYRGANSVVQYLFDNGAKLDVVDKSGRTPLKIADGVEYGNSFAAQPQTAVLLRKLGAKEIPCPGQCRT